MCELCESPLTTRNEGSAACGEPPSFVNSMVKFYSIKCFTIYSITIVKFYRYYSDSILKNIILYYLLITILFTNSTESTHLVNHLHVVSKHSA